MNPKLIVSLFFMTFLNNFANQLEQKLSRDELEIRIASDKDTLELFENLIKSTIELINCPLYNQPEAENQQCKKILILQLTDLREQKETLEKSITENQSLLEKQNEN